jgi:hypothetical protein
VAQTITRLPEMCESEITTLPVELTRCRFVQVDFTSAVTELLLIVTQ